MTQARGPGLHPHDHAAAVVDQNRPVNQRHASQLALAGLYGTAEAGGDESRCLGEGVDGCGTVWELTP